MIEHVLQGLTLHDVRYTLIIRKDFEELFASQLKRIRKLFPVSFVCVERITQGASCTALAAHRLINTAEPLLIADSDNIFFAEDISAFINQASVRQLDGSLLTFSSDSPNYSYAQLDESGYVCLTREKEPISTHAIAGAYYFRHGRDFVDAAIETLIYGDTQKGEYYMSNVYNYLINKNHKVGIYEIEQNRLKCVGTPEQLEAYLGEFSDETSQ